MAQLPYLVKQQDVDIQGVQTSLCLTLYSNTVLLIATQTGSVGVWLRARGARQLGGAALEEDSSVSVDTLLGDRRQELPSICARNIALALDSMGLHRPLLLGLGLKHYSMPVLQAVAGQCTQLMQELLGGQQAVAPN